MKVPSHISTPPKDFKAVLPSDVKEPQNGKGNRPIIGYNNEAYRASYDRIFRNGKHELGSSKTKVP